jgi:hypothetical protein
MTEEQGNGNKGVMNVTESFSVEQVPIHHEMIMPKECPNVFVQ